ncbi:MAG: DUF551 domain-containing protein [Gammaproteobacteria bacterium]|nr:DUF551 domain-containing protein [Gammaproteobacteria bacterium]MCP3698966.1 DUF551 domain-containing protein [Aliivibrio sp.]
MSKWISVEDRLPGYGDPVLVVLNGKVQYVTYMLDGADDTPDWFEPYHFETTGEEKFFWNKATHWMPLPKPPTQ